MKRNTAKAYDLKPGKVLNKARMAIRAGRVQEAVDLCNGVLGRYPKNREAGELLNELTCARSSESVRMTEPN